jgi:ComEC/Rec2-related protein
MVWLAVGYLVCAAVTPWRTWRLAAVPLGVTLALLHDRAPWDTLSQQLPRASCRLAIQAVVDDAKCPSDSLDVLPPPYAVVVTVHGLRLPGQTEWTHTAGRAVLLLPRACRVTYGDRILAEGVVLPATPAPFPGAFDYATTLRRNGVRQTIRAERVQPDGVAAGLLGATRHLLGFRDALAQRLVASMPSEENRNILLSMTFGFRQTLRADTRDAFLRSGTIHLFSVSGLHVAIVASVLGGILFVTGLPYRWRYAALPLLLGAYVVMTGSAPSAVRAWLMLSIVFLARACFLALSPLNGVALAAVVLLLRNPLYLLQAGFLYSFTTVAVLVLGWPLVSELSRDLSERSLWLPRSLRPRTRLHALRFAIRAVGGSLLAWFGGAGLMLYLSAMVVPAALPVNIVLVLVANVLLVLAIPKILLACLPAVLPDMLAGQAMSAAVGLIDGLVRLGSAPAGSWSVPSPPTAIAAAYYAALFAVFLPGLHWLWRLTSLGLAAAVLAATAWLPWQSPCTALVWGGDCDLPVAIMERCDGLPPIVIHSGTLEAHRALAGWLQRRGYRHADALVFAFDLRRAVETAPVAVRLLCPRTLVVPPESRPDSHLFRACREQQDRGGRVRRLAPAPDAAKDLHVAWPGASISVSTEDGCRRLRLIAQGHGPAQILTIQRQDSGRCQVTLSQPGAPPQILQFSPSLHRRVIPIAICR